MPVSPTPITFTRRAATVVTALGLAATLAACGSSTSSSSAPGASSGGGARGAGNTVRIGFVTTLSNNPFSGVGGQAKAAFEAGIASAEASGAKVQTFTGDDQGDPRQATQTCQRLVQQSKVDVIVAVMLTPDKNACNLIAQQAKVPFIAGQQSAVNCGSTYFQTGWIPNQVIDPALKYLASKGTKKIYFVGNDYAFDHEILNDLRTAAKAAGMTVIGNSMPPVGTTDWSPIFARVAGAKPDVVIDAMVDEVAYQKQASTDPRMTKLRRLSLTADEAQLHAAGASTQGLEYVTQYVSSTTNSANAEFKAGLKKADSSVVPSLTSVNLYNATLVAVAAARKGGDLLTNIPSVSITGPGGPLTFAGKHNPSMTSYVAKMGAGFVPKIEYTQKSVQPDTGC